MEGYVLDRKSGTSNLQLSLQDIHGYSYKSYAYKNILALHQLLKEQVDFTQGTDRARVRWWPTTARISPSQVVFIPISPFFFSIPSRYKLY